MTSTTDHVVDAASRRILREQLAGRLTEVELARSFHVATLDHDAALLQRASLDFIAGNPPHRPQEAP